MDIVYLVKNCPTNEELTYSLRSLVNIPHDRVFIVGGCPSNLNKTSLIHIQTLQTNNKYNNTTNSLFEVCKDNRLSEDFILMNDDFFILKPIKQPKAELNLCRGTIKDVYEKMKARYQEEGPYLTTMRQSDIYLRDIGVKTPLSYELHIPMVLNKNKFLELFSLPYISNAVLAHKRSIYGNLYLSGSEQTEDVKVYRDFFIPLGSNKFLSTEDNSWPRVKGYLNQLFPQKSIYEI